MFAEHGFSALTNSRLVPKATRILADRLDGLWCVKLLHSFDKFYDYENFFSYLLMSINCFHGNTD